METVTIIKYKSLDGNLYDTEGSAKYADQRYITKSILKEKENAIIKRIHPDQDFGYFQKNGFSIYALIELIEDRNRINDMMRAIDVINKKYKS